MLATLWTIPAIAGTLDNHSWRRAHDMPVPLVCLVLSVTQAIVVALSLLAIKDKVDWPTFRTRHVLRGAAIQEVPLSA